MRKRFLAVTLPAATLALCSGAEAQNTYAFVPPGIAKGITGGVVALSALPPGIMRAQSGLDNSQQAVKVQVVLPTPLPALPPFGHMSP